jgi:hypothetical protein
MLCDFRYSSSEDARYIATCVICGRIVKTRTTKAVASCRSANRDKRTSPGALMQAAGVAVAKPAVLGGPGTELKSLLRDWLGIEATANCGCTDMAAKMDALGPDWCEGVGMSQIVKSMQAEHAKRWADGRTRLPWIEAAARQLVLLACRRARAAAER